MTFLHLTLQYIQGISSNQLKIFNLEDEISRDKIESLNREFTLVPKCEGKHEKKPFTALQKKEDHQSSEYALK